MKALKRIRYYTMNSWNLSKAPAYNLKIYNVINDELQDKVYELMNVEDIYDDINDLIHDFDELNDHKWQAGFNGRSGGYLVLYSGDKKTEYYTKEDFKNGDVYIEKCGWKSYDEAKELNLVDREIVTNIYTHPGRGIEDNEVPVEVLKAFRQLAIDIVKTTEYLAKNAVIEEEEYTVTKTRKVVNF